jgi:hypothetical protein
VHQVMDWIDLDKNRGSCPMRNFYVTGEIFWISQEAGKSRQAG